MSILLAFIAFNFIVIVHEIGHFVAARLTGVSVLEFSLFFGPKLFSIKRGETVYSIRAIPAGGFVRLEGEEQASDSINSFSKKPLPARALIMFAGPFINMAAAIIILSIVFSITGYSTTGIETAAENSPAIRAGIRQNDKIISYDGKRVYQPMDLLTFLYVSKGKPVETEILRNGNRLKTIIAPETIPAQTRYYFGFVPKAQTGADSNVVKDIQNGSPADKGGLKQNDRIVRLGDTPINNRDDINTYLQKNGGGSVRLTVMRGSSQIKLDIIPAGEKIPEQYYIGVGFKTMHGNVYDVIRQGIISTYSTVRSVVYSIFWIITGKASLNQMMGPVGIFDTISSVVKQSPTVSLVIINLLNITAFLSTALGASNLLPIPPADGSKLVLLGIEAIRRKPLSMEREASILTAGVIIMIVLILFITYNDILRIFTG